MPTIMDFYNSGQQARSQQIQNRYLDPMLQQQLYTQQTNNKYLDEKNRLANQYSGLVNSYYGPEHQAAIDYQNIINKYEPRKLEADINSTETNTRFTPLKYGIEAENAVRQNSRYGGAYQYLKSISDMPAAQKAVYLADPENYQNYMQVVQTLKEGTGAMGGPQVLTPQFLKQFNLGNGVMPPQQGGGLAGTPNAPMPSPVMGNMGQGGAPIPMPQGGGLGAPVAPPQGMPPGMPQGQPAALPPNMAPRGPDSPLPPDNMLPPAMQQGTPGGGLGAPMTPSPVATPAAPITPDQATLAANTGINPQQAQMIGENATNEALTPKQRTQLGFQAIANQKIAGAPMTNRAMGAVALEKWIQDNQETFAPRIENAAKYAGALGQGQAAVDRLKKETPDSYVDYDWVVHDFIPNLGNNVKVMEKLASSDQQRKALNDMTQSAFKWDLDPKAAIKYLNMNFDMFGRESQAILNAAQPQFPGVLEKLNNVKPMKGQDYVGANRSTAPTGGANAGMVQVTDGKRTGWIPAANLDKALKIPGVKKVS